VHLYGDNVAEMEIEGRFLRLRQQTFYPWDRGVVTSVGLDDSAELALKLRIPGWCSEFTVMVNG